MNEKRDCFACRVMRSFGFTGAGALIAGLGALLLGADRGAAAMWALGGGLFSIMLAISRGRH